MNYTYDAAHHVLSRTDAIGSQTQYSYDSYGRLAEVQYYPASNGGNEDTTQRVTYYYDGSVPTSCTPLTTVSNQNATGRLTGVGFGGGMADAYKDSYCYFYVYNKAGRVITHEMSVLSNRNLSLYNNVQFSAGYQWDDEGRITSVQYPTVYAGGVNNQNMVMPIAALQYDANGRLAGMTMDDQDGNGPQPFASATYTAAGQLYQLSYGIGTETRTYNSLMQLTSQSIPGVLNMTYNYSSTANNGRITGSVDGITGESTSYTYDSLNRLTAASNSLWSQNYTYDGFGNLTSKSLANGSPNPSPAQTWTYNANNQQSGSCYDANGNLCMGTFNVENRLTFETTNWETGAANLYAYDPWGKRVMNGSDPNPYNEGPTGSQPNYTFNFYGISGQKLAMVTCNGASSYPQGYPTCAIVGQNVYFGKKLIVSGGVAVATDRLGSVRANSQGESSAYYPYGEERTSTVNGREKFGTYFRDGVGQDYADQRYYSSNSGSFFSPDPVGIKAANRKNPTSWDRYLYVLGDPVNHTDRHGTEVDDGCGDDGDMPCFSVTGYDFEDDDGGGGGGGGGDYDPCDYDPTGCDATDPTPVPDPQKQPKKGKGGKKKSGPPAPCDSPILQSQYLTEYAQMGKDLNVNAMFIMAVSLQESGWNLSHVYGTNSSSNGQPLNNLFGSTYAGGNNIAYPNIQASGTAWEQNWGSYLANSPQTIGAFTTDLTSNPNHMYNSSAAWPGAVGKVYNTLQKEFTDCNIAFPKIP